LLNDDSAHNGKHGTYEAKEIIYEIFKTVKVRDDEVRIKVIQFSGKQTIATRLLKR
jgi:hypothetical protein